MKQIKILRIKKKLWFKNNQDAKGYKPNDNRILEPEQNRREIIRRTWNI